ncbi:hypothetical protein [Methanobacterium sp. SMA-27]|uniref:hypothetical protein n=1 Tax=Methanobacterium sp. SMA-27 TaxID=1495336 RepID=UPI001E4FAC2D|nr:hypothetical protein [Methanobacterium sp. SMA-27]
MKEDYFCVYFNEPVPVRVQLIKLLKLINPDYSFNSSHITVAELKEAIVKELDHENLIIIFNHFEKLSKRYVGIYQYLNSFQNIQFICSFINKINRNTYPFYETFKILNKEEYKNDTAKDEINITYSLYIIISIICFFVYIKSANSVYMAAILLGGAWFALIIFRTMMYAGGRV